MATFIAGVDRLRAELGCAVVPVHHTGWDERRERGSNVLRASVDTLILVKRSDGGITMSCEKRRDLDPFTTVVLQMVPLGRSCVLEPSIPTATGRSESETAARNALPVSSTGPTPSRRVDGRPRPGSLKRTFHRARQALLDAGDVEKVGRRYRPRKEAATDCHTRESASLPRTAGGL